MRASPDLNLATVEARLVELLVELDQAHEALRDADEQAERAEYDHELAFARAVMSADGRNAEQRRSQAVLVSADANWSMRLAGVKFRAAKLHVRKIEQKIDVYRTLESSLRATGWPNAGRGAA